MATPSATTITSSSVPFLAIPRDRGDEACEQLSPTAFKVWYRIVRLTRGWNREEALISYNDFMRACGIKNRLTVCAAIKELIEKGFARVWQYLGSKKGNPACAYALITEGSTENVPPIQQINPKRGEAGTENVPGRYRERTAPSTENTVAPPRQPTPEAAPPPPIETLIERVIEKEDSAPDGAEVVQGKLIHFGDTDPKLRAIKKRELPPPASHSPLDINASPRARLQEEEPTKENCAPNPLIAEQRRLLEELKQKAWEANARLETATGDKRLLLNLNDAAWDAVKDARKKLAELEGEEAPEEPPPDSVEEAPQAPKNNYAAAALVLNIPLHPDMPKSQHSLLTAIAAKLNELHLKPAQAVEALRNLRRENGWVREAGGYAKLLPRYAGGVA